MKIGILTTSIGNFGKKGFYNSQEIGLAAALAKLVDEVIVYKLVKNDQDKIEEKIGNLENASLIVQPSKSLGINGFIDLSILNKSLDVLIYFSDTQLSLPQVYKWTKKNQVRLLPYIGVIESHSTNWLKKIVINVLFNRNLKIYRKNVCIAKTPELKNKLIELNVQDVSVAAVGLDLSLLRTDYSEYSRNDLKKAFEYDSKDKIILFVGRLIEEKQPLKMIRLFQDLVNRDVNYKLVIVGMGELKESIIAEIKRLEIEKYVRFIEVIPNNEIWKLYRVADVFINLNEQEIFGMAILEAMYYECRVLAWKAPGPNFIIEHEKSGYLLNSDEDFYKYVLSNDEHMGIKAHNRVMDAFMWDKTATIFFEKGR